MLIPSRFPLIASPQSVIIPLKFGFAILPDVQSKSRNFWKGSNPAV